jgi:hypothetical protein
MQADIQRHTQTWKHINIQEFTHAHTSTKYKHMKKQNTLTQIT